ncbi:hypothetical protein AVEN_154418-1 [Araneus ventricosus]|uniref:Sodium-coupled monocarboxylate transporter 1 n=1 Tax=Araneus ventricosus TaxID=182803 RepID=A0A4Y2VCW7_ARAVE|nr:hypothetical protein AVEN_227804-1 [Araneus ventricosus]GBO22372.1 hypothetical protein AVEN_154418-1 [Araneus ventricosus]
MGEWTSNDENIPKRRQEISSLPTGENTPKQARQVFPYPLKELKLDMSSHVPQYMDDKFTSKYRAALISNPILTFLGLSACLHGIVLYAVYFMCDPILNNRETGLTNYDQLVPYFLVSKFHSIPGLTGLSVAGIFCGSLTTISSVLNSLATVTVVDFVHPIFQSLQRNEKKSLLLAKELCTYYFCLTNK